MTFAASCVPLRPQLRAEALRLTRSAADADDLVHDTLEAAFIAWDSYRPRGPTPLGWLLTILRNHFIDGARQRKRHRARLAEFERLQEPGHYQSVGGTEVAQLRTHRVVRAKEQPLDRRVSAPLAEAISRLPVEYRSALELAAAGLTRIEIAEQLGVSPDTARSRLYRARERVREAALAVAADYAT